MSQDTQSESQKWIDSLEHALGQILKKEGSFTATSLIEGLAQKLKAQGIHVPELVNTPYVNTIHADEQVPYPGDRDIERRIKSIIRWNAMAMVVKANRINDGLGGHISTYASSATLYEVGFNHFFRGPDGDRPADMIYFQGHASPGNYARAFLEHRLTPKHLHNFRQELAEGGGLSSYPHPYLMPDFWRFPTVSMGLGPIMSIYQARFMQYLKNRDFLSEDQVPRVWAYIGDGESDEPETLGALTMAGREKLDNLTWIVNCNLQRLDGPVRGNGKIIQELEAIFKGAGWNVIKVIWGSGWDSLLANDDGGLLVKRMEEAVDGEYQKYTVEPGSYARKHFFGKYPELFERVNHLSDEDLRKIQRGGHDPVKVYNAYKRATEHRGQPTVILAKTVKGYGLGEAGEGRNITHQQKKMNEKEMREFRSRFDIPIKDEDVVDAPFFRPGPGSIEYEYLMDRRKKLSGFLPARTVKIKSEKMPGLDYFAETLKGSGEMKASTTMAFVRVLTKLLGHQEVGKRIVPVIPDEARTFGMDALFRNIGIYSSKGQLYEPVDSESFLYYSEAKDGQILEEGINEAGAMSSFIAAGTTYSNLNLNMIPFYIYYSMFGFQRVGDLMWLAGDIRAKGFLLGGTAGRTTLNGEGLQHQDGHSHLMASTIPTLMSYDPAYAYELAVIVQDGMRRMYEKKEEIFYYLTVHNENYEMPAMPEGCAEGIIKGMYCFSKAKKRLKQHVHLLGSGAILNQAIRARDLLLEKFNVSADVWSVTSYKQLRTDALNCQRWNMLHPEEKPRKSYLEDLLDEMPESIIAVSDNMKIVADQIAPWIGSRYFTLGTDGFGRSDTRPHLRRFFEVDAESTVIAALYNLSRQGKIPASKVAEAIRVLEVDPEKAFPEIL